MEKIKNFCNNLYIIWDERKIPNSVSVIEELEECFGGWNKSYPQEIRINDYAMNEEIAFSDVLNDRKKCINLVREFFKSEKSNVDKELVLAIYCNFYNVCGMADRFQKEDREEKYDGLDDLFESLNEKEEYLKILYENVKEQNFEGFDRILELNKESVVAKMYKFVKISNLHCHEIYQKQCRLGFGEINVDDYKEMWELYESMPPFWQKYVLGKCDLIQQNPKLLGKQLLPYIKSVVDKNLTDGKMEIMDYFLKKKDFKNSEAPAVRKVYLQIPAKIAISTELFEAYYNEFLKGRYLKNLILQREEMMNYYAHSWKHISYPQIVKEIAEELGDSNRIIANRLMKVYNSERTLQRGIQLLQYISSGDESKVSKEFRNGMALSGSNFGKVLSLQKVLCDSLDLVIFKILMVESDDSRTIETCREKWGKSENLDELREEYTKKFLGGMNNNDEIIHWTNDNLINISIEIDSEWEQVRFRDDSFAVNQFKEILVEIFTNVFLHGRDGMKIYFISNDHEMIIREENTRSDLEEGNGNGISTMRKVLTYINFGKDIQCVDTELNDTFKIIIRINKKILIVKGR